MSPLREITITAAGLGLFAGFVTQSERGPELALIVILILWLVQVYDERRRY